MPPRPKKRQRSEEFERRTITLPPDLDAKLEALAEQESRPVSNLIAHICREWLAAREKNHQKN
jgi:hypothetical protein